ncbi:MAG: AIR synthase family protein [Chromatiales bacterium]|jgi:hydrogenase maturation factor
MTDSDLPVGKLPPALLERLLAGAPTDPSVVIGPGIGLDCAVVDIGDRLLVLKSDPVTFVTDDLGRYLVQVNLNDLATTGAVPRWLLVTLLLPDGRTSAACADGIMETVYGLCREYGIAVVGGHTEITHGLDRPVASAALIGEVARDRLITPRGARPGDRVLLTKGVPIEGASILAREFPDRLRPLLGEEGLARARDLLADPGIGVLEDARTALAAGRVSAMHDPTEGGVAAALWELARASGRSLSIRVAAIPVPELCARICGAFHIDPLETIASGALLLTAPEPDARRITAALEAAGIPCADIGAVGEGPAGVRRADDGQALPWPERDGIARAFERDT